MIVREGSRENPTILHAREEVKGRGIPEWISPEGDHGAKVVSMPTREQINLPVQEQLIVELYQQVTETTDADGTLSLVLDRRFAATLQQLVRPAASERGR